MTEFETKVLQELANINQRLDGHDKQFESIGHRFESIDHRFDHMERRFEDMEHRFDRLEQRVGRIEKAQMSIATMAELLPKLVYMVDDLHNDFLERKGLLRKQE